MEELIPTEAADVTVCSPLTQKAPVTNPLWPFLWPPEAHIWPDSALQPGPGYWAISTASETWDSQSGDKQGVGLELGTASQQGRALSLSA